MVDSGWDVNGAHEAHWAKLDSLYKRSGQELEGQLCLFIVKAQTTTKLRCK